MTSRRHDRAAHGDRSILGPFAGRWRLLPQLRSHPLVTGATALVVSASVLVGLTDGTLSLRDRVLAPDGSPEAVGADPLPSPTTTTQSEPSATPTPGRVDVGTCLTDGLSPVPCGALHRFEVVTTDPAACTTATVVEHLGGRTGTDVVLVSAELVQPSTGEGEVCAVRGAGAPTYEPAAGALQGDGGSGWRWCIDTRAGRDVPCDVPHQAEYVGVDVLAPDVDACQVAAERYLEASFDRVADRLQLSVTPSSSASTQRPPCVIVARGSAVLTDSLRAVGAQALPLEQT